MNRSPKVSVALAAHNGERYLTQQIESILSQLGDEDELVISDDGSMDATASIVDNFSERDARVRFVSSDRNGIVANFNNAIAHCNGDVIFISDQDDVWLDGKREKVLEAFGRSGADLVIHNGRHVDANGSVISDPFFTMWRVGPGLVQNFMMPRYSGCCMALSREALSYVMPMPTYVENYDHWIGMACEALGTVEFIDDVLLDHRIHDSNVTPGRRRLLKIACERAKLLAALVVRKVKSRR